LRTYEALYIVTPEVEDDNIQTIADKTATLVTDNEGTIVRSEIWGRRKMAYDVNKHSEGIYVLLRFTANPDFILKMERVFKLDETVIRYSIKHFNAHELRAEAEQQKRREEEILNGRARGHDDDDDDDDYRPARRAPRPPRVDQEQAPKAVAEAAAPAAVAVAETATPAAVAAPETPDAVVETPAAEPESVTEETN
jgi:small subunit ribosomal protein S6